MQLDSGFQSLQDRAHTQESTDIKKKKKTEPNHKKIDQTTTTNQQQLTHLANLLEESSRQMGKDAKISLPGHITQHIGLTKNALISYNQRHFVCDL